MAIVLTVVGCSDAPARTASPAKAVTGTPRPTQRPLPVGVPSRLIGALASGRGIGIYDAETGRLIRSIVTRDNESLLAQSGGGRYAYVADETTDGAGSCTRRLDLETGRSRRLGFCATGLAISPDGRMLAYTKTGGEGGLTTSLVIRDLQTGRHRTTLIYQNCRGCNNGVGGAVLSWSPDDDHLAVSVYATAAIVSLQVLSAWRGSIASTPAVLGCRRVDPSCRQPVFDDSGALVFDRQDEQLRQWVVRLRGGRLTRLYRFAPHRYGEDPIVIDPRSDSFIWQDSDVHNRDRRTLLWAGGSARVLPHFHGWLPDDAMWRPSPRAKGFIASHLPPCSASVLDASFRYDGAGTMHTYGLLSVRNRSLAACRVRAGIAPGQSLRSFTSTSYAPPPPPPCPRARRTSAGCGLSALEGGQAAIAASRRGLWRSGRS